MHCEQHRLSPAHCTPTPLISTSVKRGPFASRPLRCSRQSQPHQPTRWPASSHARVREPSLRSVLLGRNPTSLENRRRCCRLCVAPACSRYQAAKLQERRLERQRPPRRGAACCPGQASPLQLRGCQVRRACLQLICQRIGPAPFPALPCGATCSAAAPSTSAPHPCMQGQRPRRQLLVWFHRGRRGVRRAGIRVRAAGGNSRVGWTLGGPSLAAVGDCGRTWQRGKDLYTTGGTCGCPTLFPVTFA